MSKPSTLIFILSWALGVRLFAQPVSNATPCNPCERHLNNNSNRAFVEYDKKNAAFRHIKKDSGFHLLSEFQKSRVKPPRLKVSACLRFENLCVENTSGDHDYYLLYYSGNKIVKGYYYGCKRIMEEQGCGKYTLKRINKSSAELIEEIKFFKDSAEHPCDLSQRKSIRTCNRYVYGVLIEGTYSNGKHDIAKFICFDL